MYHDILLFKMNSTFQTKQEQIFTKRTSKEYTFEGKKSELQKWISR